MLYYHLSIPVLCCLIYATFAAGDQPPPPKKNTNKPETVATIMRGPTFAGLGVTTSTRYYRIDEAWASGLALIAKAARASLTLLFLSTA